MWHWELIPKCGSVRWKKWKTWWLLDWQLEVENIFKMKLCFVRLTYCMGQLPVTVTKSIMRLKQKGRVWLLRLRAFICSPFLLWTCETVIYMVAAHGRRDFYLMLCRKQKRKNVLQKPASNDLKSPTLPHSATDWQPSFQHRGLGETFKTTLSKHNGLSTAN